MKRKKRSKGSGRSSIICIIAIAMLNLMGVSYASWNNRVEIFHSIGTGNIEPIFEGVDNSIVTLENDYTIKIYAEVGHQTKEIVLPYFIKNDGTLPVRLTNTVDLTNKNEVRFVTTGDEVLKPMKDYDDRLKLVIERDRDGWKEFEYELTFDQWVQGRK
ncbi:hypothetical protein IZY60_02850 [Lutibacter sp. B2]|nr:hypothetical protein [Lutibacter sp. B2]